MNRRHVLGLIGLTGIINAIPGDRWTQVLRLIAQPGAGARFLTVAELDTLRAVTARLIPGPPDDPDPGALEAHCAEAIDLLLGAFTFDPPLLYAGGPWSDRAGGLRNDMARFVAPDELQVLAWRIRLEGSQGLPEREFAGPVVGLQETYRHGLAVTDELSQGRGGRFGELPPAAQDAVLRTSAVSDFVERVLADAIDAMYGPPEYGGNHRLVGWLSTGWPGDVQPRGYADAEVRDVDVGARRLPYTNEQLPDVAAHVLPGVRLAD